MRTILNASRKGKVYIVHKQIYIGNKWNEILWPGDRKEFDAGSYGRYFSKVLNEKQSHAQSAHYLVCQKN